MGRSILLVLSGCLAAGAILADDASVVFRSDVSLVRVDTQVLDRNNRAITGLTARDFVLRADGKVQDIRNFAREDLPLDVLLLFDVSASMRPHVERIAFAAREELRPLGEHDRVAIMVFDRYTRVRMPLRGDLDQVNRELQSMLRQETFDGGTDITRALYDAASWINRNGRRDARRAIVILTDDQTERSRDVMGVGRSLDDAGAVLSLLLAPDAMAGRYGMGRRSGGYPGGGYPGGGYPGGGSPGGPLGGIIFGRGGGGGHRGGGYPGGGGGYPHTQSAGTAEIAERSGGDTFPVDDASALERTLERIRQRYALHFNLDPKANTNPRIEVALASEARSRYPNADVRYRRVNISGVASGPYENARSQPSRADEPVVVGNSSSQVSDAAGADQSSGPRRRHAVSDSSGPRGPATDGTDSQPAATNPQPSNAAPAPSNAVPPPADSAPPPATSASDSSSTTPANESDNSSHGGWRRVKPPDKP
jgi:VWFA-related protein